jgi:hypothetical protein
MRILFFSLGVLVALYVVLVLHANVREIANHGWLGWPEAVGTLVHVLIAALASFSLFYAAHR